MSPRILNNQESRKVSVPQLKRDENKLKFAINLFFDWSNMTRKVIPVVAAVIERDGNYLITQRRKTAVLPLMWEFPGGRCETGESHTEALKREIIERLGTQVEVGQLISFVSHPYELYTVDLYLYQCQLLSEDMERRAVNDFRWVKSSEFDDYTFTPADQASMNKLLGEGN